MCAASPSSVTRRPSPLRGVGGAQQQLRVSFEAAADLARVSECVAAATQNLCLFTDAESLPFYPLVLKLVVCVAAACRRGLKQFGSDCQQAFSRSQTNESELVSNAYH